MMVLRTLSAAFVLAVLWPALARAADEKPLNVLFIAIDDLRPQLGCYGDDVVRSPNIDRIASRGIVFDRAYCQEAVCCPSRLSLITGLRPDTTEVWDLATHFRTAVPDAVTLPQYFKQQGYHTRSVGKILHGNGVGAKDPPSWSEKPLYDVSEKPTDKYSLPENLEGKGSKQASTERADVPDEAYVDGLVARDAFMAIESLAAGDKPFFLAVGFRKPHLPFCAPSQYWDLYDRSEIPPPATTAHPAGAPELAIRSWVELEGYQDIPADARLSDEKIAELRHGYYACISYVDAQIGKLLAALDKQGLTERTAIVLWGDHGFQLGEQGMWTKANNFELATRVPLIVAVPGQANPGTHTRALVELVDIYPSLVEACGLAPAEGLEGMSFVPLFADPDQPWKRAAFSQYPRDRESNRHKSHGDFMGRTVRTDRYRYVEWRTWNDNTLVARELYDEEADPHESRNLAADPAYANQVADLAELLTTGWPSAR